MTDLHAAAEWWINRSEDGSWTPTGSTNRRDALLLGINEFEGEPFFIMRAEPGTLHCDLFDGNSVAELIDDGNEDACDPDGGESVSQGMTGAELKDLADRLNSVVRLWAKERGNTKGVWRFGWMGEMEAIDFGVNGLAVALRGLDAPDEIEELIYEIGHTYQSEDAYAATIKKRADLIRTATKAAQERRQDEWNAAHPATTEEPPHA